MNVKTNLLLAKYTLSLYSMQWKEFVEESSQGREQEMKKILREMTLSGFIAVFDLNINYIKNHFYAAFKIGWWWWCFIAKIHSFVGSIVLIENLCLTTIQQWKLI